MGLTEEELGEKKEIDTCYTSEIVCPYCGEKHESDNDYEAGLNRFDCHGCDREFCYEPDFEVTFCSWPLEVELEREIKHNSGLLEYYAGKGDAHCAAVYRGYVERSTKRLAELKAVAGATTGESDG